VAPITFAHRPEGDDVVGGLAAALRGGAAGLRVRVYRSADGEAVVAPAPAWRRGLRRIRVAAAPAAELASSGVPRLADLYTELGRDFELCLDLGVPEAAGPAVAAARDAGALDRLWLSSPDLDVLRSLRPPDRNGRPRLVHALGRRRYGDTLEGHAAVLGREGIAALALVEPEWSLGLVTLVRRFGIAAFAWDAREVRRLRALVEMGIDGVSSDQVDRMVATVGEWSAGPPPE
jgi:glycerophosphoryl diester phosphodiesterase